MTEKEFSELQIYIKDRMQAFERWDQFRVSVFSWMTDLGVDEVYKEVPPSFFPVPSLQFPVASMWVSLNDNTMITWRNSLKLDKKIISVYKFDTPEDFARELKVTMDYPEKWLEIGG